jgi:regulator of CtrA degradation
MDMERTIQEQVVEDLYTEALALADEARAVFDLRDDTGRGDVNDRVRMAVSIEGLRTTTRVMHALAWLLNQRSYYAGELTRLQMFRHGKLGEERPSDPENMELLEPGTRGLIRDTERLYARIRRLDEEQRQTGGEANDPVRDMHGRISEAFALR